jgi:FtsZ-binding cell division protein ZapB
MALTRESLTELGLTEEQTNSVLKDYGKSINQYKGMPDKITELTTKINELTESNTSLNTELSNANNQVKSLNKKASSVDELTKQLEDAQGKLSQTKLDSALGTALTAAKVRNPKTLKGLLDMDKIKLNDDGKLEGLDDQLESIQKSDAYLFDKGSKTNYNPNSGDPAPKDSTQAMIDAFTK